MIFQLLLQCVVDFLIISISDADCSRFLPEHASWSSNWSSCLSWRSGSAKNSPEARLIEKFKAIPSNASTKHLVRQYLELCWSLPYYGSAFFHGQVQ